MMIPTYLIVPLFLIAFLISVYQYYVVDPVRRLTDLRAVMVWGAILGMFMQLGYRILWPQYWQPSVAFLALSLAWLGLSIFLLRRMPPRAPY